MSFTKSERIKICFTASFVNQRLRDKAAKNREKTRRSIWLICLKALILHPLSREKRITIEILNKRQSDKLPPFKKTFEKNLEKVLVVEKKVLTFASAFERKP